MGQPITIGNTIEVFNLIFKVLMTPETEMFRVFYFYIVLDILLLFFLLEWYTYGRPFQLK